jgi:hypothetical protein
MRWAGAVLAVAVLMPGACSEPPVQPPADPADAALSGLPYERPGALAWNDTARAFMFEGRPVVAGRVWNFDDGPEAFTGQGASIRFSPISGTLVVNDVFDALIRSPDGLGLEGARYNLVLVRLGRESAGAPWDGALFWSTDTHGELHAFHAKPFAGASPALNETVTLAYDMTRPTRGGSDWTSSVIRQFRLDTDDGAGGSFRLRQIAIVENPAPDRLRAPEPAVPASSIGLR